MADFDIKKYADLARIELTKEEAKKLEKDIESILGYIEKIQEVDVNVSEKKAGELRNVMREDENPHESGIYTKELLDEAPERGKGYVKVKNIL